jgi:poly(hydroxyalkanoate) granule-associated protein
MAKQATIEVEVVEEKTNSLPSVVVDNVHKVFLVGLGAAAMAQDELVSLLDKFVEQGESTEKKARESVSEMVESRKKNVEDANKRAEKEMNSRIEGALNRLNIPSRSEIKALDTKITKLSKKIDELNKQPVA